MAVLPPAAGLFFMLPLDFDLAADSLFVGHPRRREINPVSYTHLYQLQKIGHQIIFLVGDFTGRIGDPSGRSETRKQLTEEQIAINAKTYTDQVFKILDPKKTVIEYNSRWLGALTFTEVIQLAAKTTVARILERDDFATRFAENRPIGLHEFLYPLMQGYDLSLIHIFHTAVASSGV